MSKDKKPKMSFGNCHDPFDTPAMYVSNSKIGLKERTPHRPCNPNLRITTPQPGSDGSRHATEIRNR